MSPPRRGRKAARPAPGGPPRPRAAPGGSRRGRGATDSPAAVFDVVRDVLDHELQDVDGVPCGVVDDVMLDGGTGKPLRLVALLVGPGGWLPRLPKSVGWVLQRFIGANHVRVPWSAVTHVGERIQLASTAADLGLGKTDRRIGALVARIPGGRRAPE